MENIGVWGDSITYGAGDEESLGWVGRLRRHIEKNSYIEIYNLGISGETSSDLLRRFAIELKSVRPEIILIAIGANDAIFKKGIEQERQVSPDRYKENLRQLFSLAKAASEQVFAVGLTIADDACTQPMPWGKEEKSYKMAILKEYDDALRAVAQEAGVAYIDMWNLLTIQDLADGIHPNAAGYEKMYRKIYEAIEGLLG
ncbi:MAG: GDSL-type esterase/lipase family protein [Candidatus Kaiserbacteria bacterium]|nr:GDSL-type esterase/lipase family protein [Candidatus Kaiserbacteria bacterium]